MNFPPQDPKRFLLEFIPNRFRSLSPDEFGSFVRYLFELDGCQIIASVNSTDFGFHFRALKDDLSMVILPIQVKDEMLLDTDQINKANRAKAFYQADQSWVITNSNFTTEAKLTADEGDIELWDWDALYEGICQLFFEGKSHVDYAIAPYHAIVEAETELKLKARWEPQEGVTAQWYNLRMEITNPTDQNVFVNLDLPALIDNKKMQSLADQWGDEEFKSGMIYAGATVHTNALFKASRLGERPPGGKVMLTCHERAAIPRTFHLSAKLKGEACYLVTYCYGRQSDEYALMISFRDNVLYGSVAGTLCINAYYLISPVLIRF